MATKRLPGEDYHEYKERRKREEPKKTLGFWGTVRRIIIPKPKPKPEKEKYVPSNPAQGKRHACESWDHFRERRRICNAKRRNREIKRKHALTPKPKFAGTLAEILEK